MNKKLPEPGSLFACFLLFVVLAAVVPWQTALLGVRPRTSTDRVAIPAAGPTYASGVSEAFGRAPYFAIVDVRTDDLKIVENPFRREEHAVGLRIAHLLIDEEVGRVVARHIGPEPYTNLSARGARIYVGEPVSVLDAVRQLKSGALVRARAPTVQVHYGLHRAPQLSSPP